MNNMSLVGNLATDPEMRFTQNGTETCNFVVAVNEKVGDVEKAHFVRVTAFGTLADNVAESLRKGQRVVIIGRLNTYSTELELADGSERRVNHVTFTASAIGPDLRWARAKVAKVVRDTEGQEEAEVRPARAARVAKAPEVDEDDPIAEVPAARAKAKPARSNGAARPAKAAAATAVLDEPAEEDPFNF